jgi:hypothetical protein
LGSLRPGWPLGARWSLRSLLAELERVLEQGALRAGRRIDDPQRSGQLAHAAVDLAARVGDLCVRDAAPPTAIPAASASMATAVRERTSVAGCVCAVSFFIMAMSDSSVLRFSVL